MALVVGHQHSTNRQRMGSDERIHLPDKLAGVGKNGSNGAEALSGCRIKRQRINAREKSVDGTIGSGFLKGGRE
jgi:hypothetical protein